jgi:hypothetical protein
MAGDPRRPGSTGAAKRGGAAPTKRATAAESSTVRLTVDVDRADHAALSRVLLDVAGELGVTRVPGQDVMRVLLRTYLTNDALQARVLAELRDSRSSR